MDKEQLAAWLVAGLSLSEIGQRLKKDASTVGYWVQRHGLVANGRAKYAPRGGLERGTLEKGLEAGMTHRELAVKFACSTSTIQYWLRRYGLKTIRRRTAVVVGDDAEPVGECPKHGTTSFVLEGRGYYRCKRCRSDRVSARRRKVKLTLVAEAGGRCKVCGYGRYPGALQFHHLDPGQKAFTLSRHGATRSIAEAREEARKCILLCSNCHAEVEAGVVKIPAAA